MWKLKSEELTPLAVPHRIAMRGPCGLTVRHDGHIFPTGDLEQDNAGNYLFWECRGQYSDCSNCDDRKCMACVFREVHDECEDSCPMCC